MMPMKRPLLVIYILFLIFAGCSYWIDISLVIVNGMPVFQFKYRGLPSKQVELYSIRVQKAETNEVIWNIATFDFSSEINKEKRGEDKKSIEIVSIIDGVVPEGFIQFYPLNGNSPPPLKGNSQYYIRASEPGGSGVLDFSIESERQG